MPIHRGMMDLVGQERHQNKMPTSPAEPVANTASLENVLEDEDPAICFVKAYARKPMGLPSTTSKPQQKANSMHHPRSDYYYGDEDEDEYDPHYEGDDFDFSDSGNEYYEENEQSSEEDGVSSENAESEETSSEEEETSG